MSRLDTEAKNLPAKRQENSERTHSVSSSLEESKDIAGGRKSPPNSTMGAGETLIFFFFFFLVGVI